MASKSSKPQQPRPWDRRPWPESGDGHQDITYAAVGRALSEWERYESVLGFLFGNLVLPGAPVLLAATRSYSAVRTFEGRAEMLRAASEAFFFYYGTEMADTLQDKFKDVLRNAVQFSQRRNDIAHGVVDHYRPPPPTVPPMSSPDEYALFPAYATFKERDPQNVPTYCYASAELDYYRTQFYSLRRPAFSLCQEIATAAQASALRGKYRSLIRRSASRSAPKSDQR